MLAATDPAQPYGASIPWPESAGRPARAAGAHVMLLDGEPLLFLERGAKSLVTFTKLADSKILEDPVWADALKELVRTRTVKKLEIAKIDGESASSTAAGEALIRHGFIRGYKGLSAVGL